ncbi:hypothetical protein [Oceanicola sp. S124]|uniref:hypothetical protein n=1 Tax=Oceanicola sp. S124 TaxID=1042378 RepID=UPI000255A96B|nr:hypothetical protein [Oceanicola sp. S124]
MLVLRLLFRNRTTSAITAVVLVFATLFTWHKVDKGSAVRKAVAEYVADLELETARARIEEIERRARVAEEAGARLQERLQAAEGEAIRMNEEIERYAEETDVPADGLVDDGLLDRLRGR